MYRSRITIVGVFVALVAGLVATTASPAYAKGYRIGDRYARTFATASNWTPVVKMRPPTGGANQFWYFQDTYRGKKIVNAMTRGCLTMRVNYSTARPPVIQRSCRGNLNERWRLRRLGDGTVMFRNIRLDRCMGINRNYSPPRLFGYRCDPSHGNQRFRLR